MSRPDHDHWSRMPSGIAFDFRSLDSGGETEVTIDPFDVCACLTQRRFQGVGWTVAFHSVVVGMLAGEIVGEDDPGRKALVQALGYLHDAHESYLTDWPGPMMRWLRDTRQGAYEVIAEIRDQVDAAVRRRFGLEMPISGTDYQVVKRADELALLIEYRDRGIGDLGDVADAVTKEEVEQIDRFGDVGGGSAAADAMLLYQTCAANPILAPHFDQPLTFVDFLREVLP